MLLAMALLIVSVLGVSTGGSSAIHIGSGRPVRYALAIVSCASKRDLSAISLLYRACDRIYPKNLTYHSELLAYRENAFNGGVMA